MNKVSIPPKQQVACVDVHVQNTFTPLCPDELPVPDALSIVPELNKQAEFAGHRIGVKEAHHPDAVWIATEQNPVLSPIEGENVDVHWPKHSIQGTKGFALIDGMPAITEYDYYVWEGVEPDMHPYGVCYHDQQNKISTGIIEYLRCHKVNTVLVGGLATDYCVKVSVLQLLDAGFGVIVNLAACCGLDEKTITLAKKEMTSQGAKFINSCSDLEQA